MAVIAVLTGAAPAGGQTTARLSADATFHREPGGTHLVTLNRGSQVTVVRTRGNWTEVTVEAWIWSRSVGGTTRDGFNTVVTAPGGENLRLQPDGQIIGRAVTGALFSRVRVQGGWTRVRRTGWVASSAVPQPAVARQQPAAPAAPVGQPAAAPLPRDTTPPPATASPAPASPYPATGLVRGTTMSVVPGGERFAELTGPADARVVGRQGDWVRVRLEGWVRAADLADPRAADVPRITAEDLRRDPERFVGETVDWRLQFLAIQVADELRPEIPMGQPYLLARGPLPEAGFVYVILSRAQLDRFRQMAPLDEFEARAVIRAARTRYLPNPVIELRAAP
jgi:hypothetical protein